jgi:hypothetical protein
MGCVSSEEVVQQYSPSSSTSSLEMIELIETKEMIYKNNIKKLFKECNNKKNNCYDIQRKWKTKKKKMT